MKPHFVGATNPLQQAVEQVRQLAEELWSPLASVRGASGAARILFTSAEEGCGSTVITAACAMGLARNLRQETTVVEAHLTRPALATYLGLPAVPGLSDVLVGRAQLAEARYQVPGCPSLYGVPGGSPRPAVAGEFADERARGLLSSLGDNGAYVLIDAPPIVDHPEVMSLLASADACVLVLGAGTSQKTKAQRAVRLIENVGVPLLGSVLNRFKSDQPFQSK